jgi:diketogulonate reductase-like aldo/keto reductase
MARKARMMRTLKGIPILGCGTFPLRGDEAYRTVRLAIDLGIYHIDTAQMYGNEADVGRAIRDCGVPRHELYVVTKVDPGNLPADRFAASVARSMDDLGGPADLLLIHWPPEAGELDAALERLVLEMHNGMTRHIGVSNFTPNMLRRAYERTDGKIINNQVEFHPLLDQRALVAEARKLGVVLSAYSPLGRGAAMKPEAIQDIAKRMGRPPSEVVLRWIIQQDVVAMPMTTKRENAASNLRVLNFELSSEDMAEISKIGRPEGRLINPHWMAGRWND